MKTRIYLDHAATTAVHPDVLAEMLPYFIEAGHNPSSLHAEGRAARTVVDDARASVARVLSAAPREIVFTGSGSEADGLALLGAARALVGLKILDPSTPPLTVHSIPVPAQAMHFKKPRRSTPSFSVLWSM